MFQFGDWALIAPAEISAGELVPGPQTLPLPAKGAEFLLYWQGGKERALAVRFSAEDPRDDIAVLRSRFSTERIRGCELRGSGSIPALRRVRPAKTEAVELPDDGRVVIAGSERGLVRHGEVLAFDLGTYRVQVSQDSPVVRVGEWDSADFCRFELENKDD